MELKNTGSFDGFLNPLLNDCVLRQLFKTLDMKTLLDSRLVCSKWKFTATPCLKKANNSTWKNIQGSFELYNFLEKMKQGQIMVWSRFFLENIPLNDSTLETFLSFYGSEITHLRLYRPKRPSYSFVRRNESTLQEPSFTFDALQEFVLRKLCNLEYLALEYIQTAVSDVRKLKDSQPIGRFMQLKTLKIGKDFENMDEEIFERIFQKSFRLKEIRVIELNQILPTQTSLVLQALTKVNKCRIDCITSLKLVKLDTSDLQKLLQLSQRGLKLRKFHFEVLENGVTKVNFEQFLTTQTDSLENLRIGALPNPNPNGDEFKRLRFPCTMKRLSTLIFRTISLTCGYPTLCDAVKQSKLPLLTQLTIGSFCSYNSPLSCWSNNNYNLKVPEHLPPNFLCHSVTSLRILEDCAGKNKEMCRYLAKHFPSVRDLYFNCTIVKDSAIVWKSWPDLQHLKWDYYGIDDNLDSELTGLSPEECDIFLNQERPLENEFEVNSSDTSSILNLSNLQIFEFTNANIRSRGYRGMSDVTGYLVFLRMKNLRQISLDYSTISDECSALLKSQISICSLGKNKQNS